MRGAIVVFPRMPMSWRCPECCVIIRHRDCDATPRTGEWYRCAFCRLDLQFNSETQRLTVPFWDREHAIGSLSARASRLPLSADRR